MIKKGREQSIAIQAMLARGLIPVTQTSIYRLLKGDDEGRPINYEGWDELGQRQRESSGKEIEEQPARVLAMDMPNSENSTEIREVLPTINAKKDNIANFRKHSETCSAFNEANNKGTMQTKNKSHFGSVYE
mmetsp:Transcript_20896/g.35931  ORF Transcript_20896/g.35931 Transcript_20896/m.35931 type:complete len:132 (-) Transcript_20896:172-567(-)